MKKILIVILVVSLAACSTPPPLEISSPAFANEGAIPSEFTCDGIGVSPALTWTEPPAGTKSFTIIADDPFAPPLTYTHWVIYNIPAAARELKEAVPNDAQLSDGSMQGMNSGAIVGYQGPCPPTDEHRYIFTLYALDNVLSLSGSGNKTELTLAMEGHILATAELAGTYIRK